MFSPYLSSKTARRGFTLTEILVVVAVIGLLGALLFPVFGRARESSRQSHCAGNLQNIYLATRQYREDYQGFPPTLEVLLPAGLVVTTTMGTFDPLAGARGGEDESTKVVDPFSLTGGNKGEVISSAASHELGTERSTPQALAYLKTANEVVCPADRVQLNGFSSSYGAKIGSVWNFQGYDRLGFSLLVPPGETARVNPNLPYNMRTNPAKFSLSNRFAPPSTVVTHCIFHRLATSGLKNPYALGTDQGDNADGASDIVLRLDGTAKRYDVSHFSGETSDNSSGNWQIQTF